jgi:CDP-2,3-bis-(O-geranylgeranyl)-sn-glycerol synthase
MIDSLPVLRVLLLLGVANGAPVFAKKFLNDSFDAPLDAGIRLADGQPLFGASKTIRGVTVSVVLTALAAMLLGLDWDTGAVFAAASLAGDLLSSFLKRRRGLELHAQAFGLDQIPEALIPLLLLRTTLGLSAMDIAVTVVAFIILELVLSRLLFMLNIRDRPY